MNGGWTTNLYVLSTWRDVSNSPQFAYEYDNGPIKAIYKDDKDKEVLCSITVAKYNAIVAGVEAMGWNIAQHGKPCAIPNNEEPYIFGTHDHRFIIATNGAYFRSARDNYSYWERNVNIRAALQSAFPTEAITMRTLYPFMGTYVHEDFTLVGDDTLGMYSPK